MSMNKKPYLVSRGNDFSIMLFARTPKAALIRYADAQIGKGTYMLRQTKVETPHTYKIVLANGNRTSVTYYDILRKP